ncbi:hypothetical protein RclHR1_01460004 [Rhizophagus clarus]|uniref:F-box domain-containing protein n=1 Tax=Rhizophagus clarus TaxID=94130 RepID=A0A2Z6QSF3_9GLOM|nr:hypothetical protein RclHR1_01460004 [Rhizophagus clarus]GES74766.1 hypothetical protein GLOIN_2v1780770 [Rhizophagus clarus]
MSKLNRDVLYSIFEKLKDDNQTLLSSLSVNRIWCEIIIPIFWKDPWKRLCGWKSASLLFGVIISHLSDESRKNIDNKFLKNYKKPLFNYISFCKNLNLIELENIINIAIDSDLRDDHEFLFYKGEIYNLFINKKTKFTQLYLPREFSDQIHLIPGAKECFSEIEFLNFYSDINEEILIGLSEICKSIKKLEIFITTNANSGIIKLIDAQKRLKEVYFDFIDNNESICKSLENSLIKHGKNIEYIKLKDQSIIKILSYFENLKVLEVGDVDHDISWDHLAAVSLPILQVLNARNVPINVITSLIEKTNGHLNEIRIDFIDHDDINNKRLIQAIYQNCPNLKYLELLIRNNNISEFEKLLIKCKYLDGLFILITDDTDDWTDLFEVLTRSSPSGLYKFKFYFYVAPSSESLRLFFDNWKGRHPMLLHVVPDSIYAGYIDIDMINEYKQEGIIKIYEEDIFGDIYEDFEWISEKIQMN